MVNSCLMTVDEVIRRLRESNRAQVERETKIPYRYLRHLVEGSITNPGSRRLDALRAYFAKQAQH